MRINDFASMIIVVAFLILAISALVSDVADKELGPGNAVSTEMQVVEKAEEAVLVEALVK